jgi:glycine cleavage system protein P-like pyridoxal-binding family
MEMIMKKNLHKLMKRLMKKMKLMHEMILNHRRRKKERNIHLKEVKKEILGCKDPYHILKR